MSENGPLSGQPSRRQRRLAAATPERSASSARSAGKPGGRPLLSAPSAVSFAAADSADDSPQTTRVRPAERQQPDGGGTGASTGLPNPFGPAHDRGAARAAGPGEPPSGAGAERDASPEAVEPGPGEGTGRSRRTARTGAETGRSGRNLPVALGVGVGLAAAVLASLLFRKELFVALVSAAVLLAVWELVTAMTQRKINAPMIPLLVGSVGMLVSGYVAHEEGLLVALTTTAFGLLLWRLVDGLDGAARDVAAGVFVAAYVPFLAGFAMIMLAEPDGPNRVITFVATVVASDTGGYFAGVTRGRHPMAPTVSPKKSWEGFAGSVLASTVVAVLCVTLLLDGPWWAGVLLGPAVAFTATMGDLNESLIKRDLGVKDMSSLLPGHGGMMDRLDSLLVTAPVAFVLLALLAPAVS